jgi:hypothetical protein
VVSIRTATMADLPAIVRMGVRFMETAQPCGNVPADPCRLAVAAGVCLETGEIWLAEEDAKPIGMLAIYTMEHPLTGERVAEELAFWVNPESRSLLTGPKLLRCGMNWARQEGVGCLKMGALAGSRFGIFLKHMGFAEMETAFVLRF